MKISTILAGAASPLAIAALIVSAAPALAQSSDGSYGNGPQYSTPQEQDQTRALNQQAQSGTTQSPEVLNGQAQGSDRDARDYGNPPADAGYAGQPDQSPPMSGPQQPGYYGDPQAAPPPPDRQQQYNDRMQQYGEQQDQYQQQRAQYESDVRAYDRALYDWAYPAPITYRYDGGVQSLYLIAEPSQQLFQIPVEDPNGRWVGRVRNIETAPDGRPARVEVALNRRVSVWVRPGDLRYDAADGVLFTDLSRAALWQLPGATVESGPM